MDRTVLITGGASGIGLALADAFLARGDRVAVCGRSQAALDRVGASRPGLLAIQADVTDEGSRRAMLEALASAFGRLDILVNNAGVFVERDLAGGGAALDGLEDELAVNLAAPIRLTGEVLARWPAPAAILFVTSGYALVTPTRAPTYAAAKAGLHAFADGLREQLRGRGVHVLELLPPLVDTPMTAATPGPKMTAAAVAKVTLEALDRGRDLALPGQVRMLPLLLRLAPATVRRMAART